MAERDDMPSHHGMADDSQRDFPDETLRLLCLRASCRNFLDKKIPSEVMQDIFEAGIHSATGGNLQPYSIIKIEDPRTNQVLMELSEHQRFIAEAPVNLIFCIDFHRLERWAKLEVAPFTARDSFRHFWIAFQDTVIAAQNICTAADALGLGSVYIGTTLEYMRELRQMLELPPGVIPVVLLCLGYPVRRPDPRRKLGPEVIVHNEKYRELSDEELRSAFDAKYPGFKVAITDERLADIDEVCRKVHGQAFAGECLAHIRQQGYINAVQRYFGLHYRADLMPENNEDFVQILRECGFKPFEEYRSEKG